MPSAMKARPSAAHLALYDNIYGNAAQVTYILNIGSFYIHLKLTARISTYC